MTGEKKGNDMKKDVIIACDFPSKEETLLFLNQFTEQKPFIKIGMELFYAEGPSIIRDLKERGHKIFLDLKLHDIPNTVKRAISVLANYEVDIINVHAAGTKAMMSAALEGISQAKNKPLLIAVTQLTSTDIKTMQDELLIKEDFNEVVMRYALNAKEVGLNGVVCSPLEAKSVHSVCGEDFITVTPGIRFNDNVRDDQKNVATPALASKLGSDYIVVGRPITRSDNPVEMYNRCVNEFVNGK